MNEKENIPINHLEIMRVNDRWMLNAQIDRPETSRFIGGSASVSVGAAFLIR